MSRKSLSSSGESNRRRPKWWPWHQRLGVGFSALFVVVVLTGIALNHTGGLKLDERFVTNSLILDWYGMAPAGEPVAFEANGWAVQWGESIYWDGVLLGASSDIKGAVELGELRVVASSSALFLVTAEGQLVERLDGSALPAAKLQAISASEDRMVVRTAVGEFWTGAEFARWRVWEEPIELKWRSPRVLPDDERERVLQAYRGKGLSVYRVLLDLHSGRFFGAFGVFIVDAAALAMLFLTATGVWYALRIKRR